MSTPSNPPTPPDPSEPLGSPGPSGPSMPPPPEAGTGYAPGYPQPPYGYPQPPYGYPPFQRAPETNSMAIVALIMIFVFPPLAVIFGFIAKNQIERTGEQGRGFAIAGIAAGFAVTALWILVIVLYIVLFATLFHNIDQHTLFQPN